MVWDYRLLLAGIQTNGRPHLLHQRGYFLLRLGKLLHFLLVPSVVQWDVLVELRQFRHLLRLGLGGGYDVLLVLSATEGLEKNRDTIRTVSSVIRCTPSYE